MPRIIALILVIALTLAGTLALGALPNAGAQDPPPDDMAGHPVVGGWYWENSSTDPFDDSFAVFHADGTYVEETPYIGTGIGVWEATGERSADLIIVFQDIEGAHLHNPRRSDHAKFPCPDRWADACFRTHNSPSDRTHHRSIPTLPRLERMRESTTVKKGELPHPYL